MPDEIIEEDLTEVEPFDMNKFVTDLEAEEVEEEESSEDTSNDDVADDEEGPSDESEGELSKEEDGTTDEEEQEEEESETEVVEEEEPKTEVKVDPRDAEIEALKTLARDTNQQLINILEQQVALNRQQVQAPLEPVKPVIRDEVAKLALFGGDEKAWDAFSPAERAEGTEFAKIYMDRVTRHAKDPGALYTDLIQDKVLHEIQKAMAPLLRDTHQQRGQEIIDRHAKDLLSDHRQRLTEVFNTLPGSRSDNWKDMEASFKAAAQLVRDEVSKEDLVSRERKVETSKRQKQANKDAAKSRGRRGSRRPPKNQNKGGWDPTKMSLAERAQALQDKE